MINNSLVQFERFAVRTISKSGTCRNITCHAFHRYHTSNFLRTSYSSFITNLSCTKVSNKRFFVSASTIANELAPKLRVLDVNTVKNIYEELRSIDKNSDERIDASELKQLLRKHNAAFSDEEIFELTELFYAGKAGGSVPFEKFVEAMDRAVRPDDEGKPANDSNNPLEIGTCASEYIFHKDHGYTNDELQVKQTHLPPSDFRDRMAYNAVKVVRFAFDTATGWNSKSITPEMVLTRTIYLETIAAVPGMVAAIVRHFYSLRNFKRDNGMMQMFLDEANNERMHLLTFVRMKDPGYFLRFAVIGGQIAFGSAFLLAYAISPRFCHRFVGYVEEEAVSTYTKIIHAIESAPDDDALASWRTQQAPKIARSYWKLGENGTVLDMIYAVRADEAEHRDVNHYCSKYEEGMPNPVYNPHQKLNSMLAKYVRDMMDRKGTHEDLKPRNTMV